MDFFGAMMGAVILYGMWNPGGLGKLYAELVFTYRKELLKLQESKLDNV